MCASRLEALLMLESDEDEDESDDNSDMVDTSPKLTKVSSGLFGIKTGTTKRIKGRMGMKKLRKNMRNLMMK